MTCVEISELNGRVGNTDYWQKSRQAEHEILNVVSRLIQRPIQQNEIQGRHVCDFVTAQGYQGDVKIWSGSLIKVELMQTHRSGHTPGWYHAYEKLPHFGGLITINHWHSAYLGTGVFKARWIPWHTIQTGVAHARHMKSRTGEWCELNPTKGEHYWLGDFVQVPSVWGAAHQAFDTHRFHANSRLRMPDLYTWF
jgi:hypothetical protein